MVVSHCLAPNDADRALAIRGLGRTKSVIKKASSDSGTVCPTDSKMAY